MIVTVLIPAHEGKKKEVKKINVSTKGEKKQHWPPNPRWQN